MVGTTISHYRILDKLGGGGMGVVYKAEDTRLGRLVALKFLPDDLSHDAQALERFQREARAASALNHPNICTIHDIDHDGGRWFIVMELLEGCTLRDKIAGRPLPTDELLDFCLQIAGALEAAHSKGVVHRDIKPANIFLTSGSRAKVLDFGLAKLMPEHRAGGLEAPTISAAAALTSPGSAMGTIAYMSPEQARGEELDPRTDLFSLGAVIYEMAAGRPAVSGPTTAVIFDGVLNRAPATPTQFNPKLPAELERIILKALEKDRATRYQTASDLVGDLKRLKRQTESGTAATEPAVPRRRSSQRLTPAAIAALVAIVAGATWGIIRYAHGHREPPAPITPRAAVHTLAVLPFRDLGGEGSTAGVSWGVGMADAVISRLVSLENLAVRPTSSVLRYTQAPGDPAQAARDLKVESVLDGAYQRIGNVIRVSVQLVDGNTSAARWAGRYDLRADEMLHFQDELAQKVVEGLRVQVSPAEQKSLAAPMTASPEAYNLYVQARSYANQYFTTSSREAIQRGRRLAEQAIAKDPGFAEGYDLLGFLYGMEAANFVENGRENLARAEENAQRAIRLNPRLAEAYATLGAVYTEGGRNEEGVRTLRQAVALAPNSPKAWDMLGYAYHYIGLNELAEQAYSRSVGLDPTTPRIHWMHARMLLYVDRAPDAEQEMRRVLAATPNQFKAMAFLGEFLYYQGKLQEAEQILARSVELGASSGDDASAILAGFLYAARGERQKIAPRILRQEPSEVIDGDFAYWVGGIHALLGERSQALAWLRRTVELGNHNYPWFARDKNWEKLRADAGYQHILSEVKKLWERYRSEFGGG